MDTRTASASAAASTVEAPTADGTSAEAAAPEVAIRENELILSVGEGITTASFTLDESNFDITSGQPSGEPPVLSTFLRAKGQLIFRVFAGRKLSGSVADLFNSRTRVQVATRRAKASGGPSELNFTFSGTLILNGDSFPNFNVGQGSKSTRSNPELNNWWVGVPSGEAAAGNGDAFLCLAGRSDRYQITLPGDDSFNLSVRVLGEGEPCG
jgi:hypothetical protein